MNKARKQATTRRNIAIIFFVLAAGNILMKIFGLSSLDTSSASTFNGAIGIKLGYYAAPLILVVVGWFFLDSSKNKALEAESIEARK
ncbi:hypothetical protein [Aliidiomarina soli]|nr:hypothetical protein [Aliidiomarina soli]